MKPHPRIRKAIKWAGAAATVLLVVVCIGSGWFTRFFHPGGSYLVGASRGRIALVWIRFGGADAADSLAGMYRANHEFGMEWWFSRSTNWKGVFQSIPMWTLALPLLIATVWAWRLDALARRRAKLNLCPKCGYDRTGLASKDAKCPECGSTPP